MTASRLGRHRRAMALGVVTLSLAALALTGCASNDATATGGSGGAGGGSGASASAGSNSGTGILPGEPDVNGDGKVTIGVLSPGDIHDHGYYESFVDSADAFAKQNGWKVISRGSVDASDALNAARALCQQKVDMVALAASELADAIPASQDPVCAGTAWYVPSSVNVNQTPRIFLSTDDPNQDMLAAGYAAGLMMKAKGITKAGYIAGPTADYAITAGKAFDAGIRMVLPNATLIKTFDGDADDSAKGKEAAQAQIDQGVGVIYPYLGGSTDAVAELANQHDVLTLTPGTDRCDSTSPKFDISVLFSPGGYFTAALDLFKAGKLSMGTTRVWTLGKDPSPTVKYCSPSGSMTSDLDAFMKKIGSGQIDPAAEVKKLGK